MVWILQSWTLPSELTCTQILSQASLWRSSDVRNWTLFDREILKKIFSQKILIFVCCALIRLEQIGDMNILGMWGCVMRREVWEKWRVFLPEQLWCCISWRFQNTPWFQVWNMPLVMANLGCQLTHLGRGDLNWGLASIRLACEPFFSLLIDI